MPNLLDYLKTEDDNTELIHSPPVSTAMKLLGDDGNRVGGYLVVWGDVNNADLQGEYFTPDTDLGLDWYTQRPVLYHHGLDGTMEAKMIGAIDTLKPDEVGVWAEAGLFTKAVGDPDEWEEDALEQHNEYIERVKRLIKRGALGWSSGSLPHLVQKAADGRILKWPIVEGSLTPTPAEPRRTWVGMIKAALQVHGLRGTDASHTFREVNTSKQADDPIAETSLNGDTAMLTDEMKELIRQFVMEMLDGVRMDSAGDDEENKQGDDEAVVEEAVEAAVVAAEQVVEAAIEEAEKADDDEAVDVEKVMTKNAAKIARAAAKAVMARQERKRKSRQEARKAFADARRRSEDTDDDPIKNAGGFGNGTSRQGSNRITVSHKFDHMSAEDASYYMFLMQHKNREQHGTWRPGGDEYTELMRVVSAKAVKQYEQGRLDAKSIEAGNGMTGLNAIKATQARAASGAMKADELDYSTQAGFGDEWVPTLWRDQIWLRARLDNIVAPLFTIVEMPSNPYELPIESTDPTVYHVPETKDEASLTLAASGNPIPDSKVATGKKTLTAAKLGLRVGISTELVEDAVIPVINQMRNQAQRAILNAIDHGLLNGDTVLTANTNLNLIDGTPTNQKYTAINGLLKNAIITETTNAIDGLGLAPSLSALRRTRFALSRDYNTQIGDLAWLVSSEVYAKLLGLDEFITMDKAGPQATAMTGQIGFIDGIPVLNSAEMALANSAGKIPAAGGTLGRMACVVRSRWYVGYRRQMNVSLDFLPYYDAYQLTATIRLAFINFDNDSLSVLYNIAV